MTERLLPTNCLNCQTFLCSHEQLGLPLPTPKVSTALLCAHCGQLHAVDRNGRVRLPTRSELRTYLTDDRIIGAYAALFTFDNIAEAVSFAQRLAAARDN